MRNRRSKGPTKVSPHHPTGESEETGLGVSQHPSGAAVVHSPSMSWRNRRSMLIVRGNRNYLPGSNQGKNLRRHPYLIARVPATTSIETPSGPVPENLALERVTIIACRRETHKRSKSRLPHGAVNDAIPFLQIFLLASQ